MTPDDSRHGTVSGYNRIPCREMCCRRAYARWRKERDHDERHGRLRVIDATGSRRRIEALQALGWSTHAIAAEVGCNARAIWNVTIKPTINKKKAARIKVIYDRLSMLPCPGDPSSVSRTLAFAKRRGFVTPLAWDDDAIDDPNGQPHKPRSSKTANPEPHDVDPVIVDRAMRGERVKANTAERAEVARRWLESGKSLNSLDELQGWNCRRDHRRSAA